MSDSKPSGGEGQRTDRTKPAGWRRAGEASRRGETETDVVLEHRWVALVEESGERLELSAKQAAFLSWLSQGEGTVWWIPVKDGVPAARGSGFTVPVTLNVPEDLFAGVRAELERAGLSPARTRELRRRFAQAVRAYHGQLAQQLLEHISSARFKQGLNDAERAALNQVRQAILRWKGSAKHIPFAVTITANVRDGTVPHLIKVHAETGRLLAEAKALGTGFVRKLRVLGGNAVEFELSPLLADEAARMKEAVLRAIEARRDEVAEILGLLLASERELWDKDSANRLADIEDLPRIRREIIAAAVPGLARLAMSPPEDILKAGGKGGGGR